jgi:hypothetical protein
MAIDNVTSIGTGRPPRQSEVPINIINDRLGQARATLDLIHTGLNDDEFVDGLYAETLAIEAAERWSKGVRS